MTKGIRLYTEIDEELNVWFDKCERDGWTIMDYMIQREAKTIYRRLNNIPEEQVDIEFKASNSWLDGFRQKFGIVKNKATGADHKPEHFEEVV